MNTEELSDKEILVKVKQLTEEVLRCSAILEHRFFDSLHSRAVLVKGATEYEADIAVAEAFEKIVANIRNFDPERSNTVNGYIQRNFDFALADARGERGKADWKSIDADPREIADPSQYDFEDVLDGAGKPETSIRRGNKDWTPFVGYQYLQCTVITVEDLEEGDRAELRQGPERHPGHQRPALSIARKHYRERYEKHCEGLDPVLLHEE